MSDCTHGLGNTTECPKCKKQICVKCFCDSVKANGQCPICKEEVATSLLLELTGKSENGVSLKQLAPPFKAKKRNSMVVTDNLKVTEQSELSRRRSVYSDFSGLEMILESSYTPDASHDLFEKPDSSDFVTFTSEKGWDTKIIQTATYEKMIEIITRQDFEDSYFAECLIFGYSTFTTKESLMDILTKRMSPQKPEKMDWEVFVKTVLVPIRTKIVNFIRTWAKWRCADFMNENMSNKVDNIIQIHSEIKPQTAQFMSDYMKKLRVNYTKPIEQLDEGVDVRKNSEFDVLSAIFAFWYKDVAQQIMLMQYDLFRRIPVEELLSQGWMKKENKVITPNIVKMMQMTNSLSYKVQTTILSLSKLKHRIFAVEYFIKVAQEMKEIHNFDGFKSILAALNASPIFRLKDTFDGLSDEFKRTLSEFNDLVDYDSNFKKLREMTNVCKPPCVPFLGSTLGDLVFTKENEKSENGQLKLVNFFRVRMYGLMLKEIVMKQNSPPSFYVARDLENVIQRMRVNENEDTLFDISKTLEETRSGELSKENKKAISKGKEGAEKMWKKYNAFWKKNTKITVIGTK
ncbi:guanine nucleotide exchange factor, putative [Entamoeba invadens IP1]|uniref:Guanine nucleotide exchange factor, putative n=1 Tax=Entamoeba invadens IP1 TaxID=370355 RepID=A0A0A1TWX6_ENTIV|nr:guanine nucleotide exchange factor, putative [Entamoeba invadens IP1]ELP85790.1 guanine nucleotide exchange factor, putative [Entamoeba invadens IP1]|eukprot:XP_004185136.1 guanine nucleotide exchange factor, putative [Entamoeba invadens IP1]